MQVVRVINRDDDRIYDGNHGLLPPHKQHFYRDIRQSIVLDIGCGAGQAGRYLSSMGNTLDGLTFSEQEARLARPYYRRLWQADLNASSALATVTPPYDAVLLGDILEHLVEPSALLVALKPLLATKARLYISVPNIANIVPRWELLLGRFDYRDGGIMDNTHLRFFTVASAIGLLQQTGFSLVRVEYSHWNWQLLPRFIPRRPAVLRLEQTLKNILTRLWPGLFATQVMMVASWQGNLPTNVLANNKDQS
jgi:SAM-dependent methyltransferase